MEQKMVKNVNNTEKIFAQRMEKHQDELRWLYMELYGNEQCMQNFVSRCMITT